MSQDSIEPYFVGELRLYCQQPDCAARQVRVVIKVIDVPIHFPYYCPLCRHEAVYDGVMTRRALQKEADYEATARMAERQWSAEHPNGGSVSIGLYARALMEQYAAADEENDT